jgi:uncharacterized delta-60 repeat protein
MKKTLLFLIFFLQFLIASAQNSTDVLQSFGLHPGVSSTVHVTAVQTDGKILVGGNFKRYQGVLDQCLVRLNVDGSKDSSFNMATIFGSKVNSLVIQPDGKILVGGDFTNFLTRINPDGNFDTAFNTNIKLLNGYTSDGIYSILLQSDGKIIVAGGFVSYKGISQNHIIRLNPDGTKDNSFDIGTGFDGNVFTNIYSMALQPDGKIIVGGSFGQFQGNYQGSLIRLNSDGSKDSTFENKFVSYNTINCITVQPDSKIIVGGDFSAYESFKQNGVIRLNPDGSVDEKFNTKKGFGSVQIESVFLEPNGKIIVGGNFTMYQNLSQKRLLRLNSDGSKDESFNIGNGFSSDKLKSNEVVEVKSITMQTDGKLIIGGTFNQYQNTTKNNIVRINYDGSIERSFDTGNGLDDAVLAIASQSDKKFIAAGSFTTYNGIPQNRIIRFNPDGTKDTSFNIGDGFNNTINCLLLQPDGKIIIGGNSDFLTRRNPDGTLDGSFSRLAFESSSKLYFEIYIKALALQDDGKIIVGGNFGKYGGLSQEYLVRLNANGSKDDSFNIGKGFNGTVNSILVQPDGKVIVGGNFSFYQGLAVTRGLIRLNADGSKDNTFIPDVYLGAVYCMKLQPDSKIIIGGSGGYFVRLNADGSKDTSFNTGTGFHEDILALYLQADGKILVGGRFISYKDLNQNHIVRLNADGSKDTSFEIGSGFTRNRYDNAIQDNSISAIDVQSDGVIIAGGQFGKYKDVRSSYLVTLNGTYITSPLTATTSQVNVACTGSSSGSATVTVLGGKRPYSYLWSNGAKTEKITGLTADTYSCTVTDTDLTTITENFTITTDIDTQNPTITAPVNITVNENSNCKATGVVLGNPVTADNCSVASVTNNAPAAFPIGNTTVTWTVKDASNNTATATQIVTVKDVTFPTIKAPASIIVNTNANCTATGVVLGNPVTADNCSVASVTNNAPSAFPIGETTVTWTVKDASNNSSTAKQLVTVKGLDVTVTNSAGTLSVAETGAIYKWFICDNGNSTVIPNEINSNFTPKKSGSYAVEVTKNGCYLTSSCFVMNTLGTKDFDNKNAFKLYPNPTKDFITIELNFLKNAKLNVFDISGHSVLSKELKSESTTVNISNLPVGVYMFQIINESGSTIRKVIKK